MAANDRLRVLLFLGSIFFCWFYRTWRFRRRMRYRVPHEDWSGAW